MEQGDVELNRFYVGTTYGHCTWIDKVEVYGGRGNLEFVMYP